MFSLFSLSNNNEGSSGPRAIDLQLLATDEVLKIWDQSQSIISALEEKGLPVHMSMHYSRIIEQELQNRAQLTPNIFFQANYDSKNEENENDASAKKSGTSAPTVLAMSVLI